MARAKELFFVGGRGLNGQPLTFIETVPARDLSEADIADLSDEVYDVLIPSGCYSESKGKGNDLPPGAELPPVAQGQTVAEVQAQQDAEGRQQEDAEPTVITSEGEVPASEGLGFNPAEGESAGDDEPKSRKSRK